MAALPVIPLLHGTLIRYVDTRYRNEMGYCCGYYMLIQSYIMQYGIRLADAQGKLDPFSGWYRCSYKYKSEIGILHTKTISSNPCMDLGIEHPVLPTTYM